MDISPYNQNITRLDPGYDSLQRGELPPPIELNDIAVTWLGQAGFLIQRGALRIVIDPYLSDSLARKYVGKHFPHRRLHPPPLQPGDLTDTAFVFSTHRHTDHMDPDTLRPLAEANPACRFIVPQAELAHACGKVGLPASQVFGAKVGQEICLEDDIVAIATPAAHETLDVDDQGHHHFLGYVLRIGDTTLYHSGDSVPFDGLVETLRAYQIDLALLPTNGRDAYRRSHGVPGNFTQEEAIALCQQAGIPRLIPHHTGLFDFS